jgi:hypothetical protein
LQKRQGKEDRKKATLGKRSVRKMAKLKEGKYTIHQSLPLQLIVSIENTIIGLDGANSLDTSSEGVTENENSYPAKSKLKRARGTRRVVAKSEPPSQSHKLVEGVIDSDVTAVSSGEGSGQAMV